jgi:hypothetical protein
MKRNNLDDVLFFVLTMLGMVTVLGYLIMFICKLLS